MLGTIYVGMAGMNAYSKGLDVISNNVANLNTTGYKAGVASFAEVVYRNGAGAMRGSSGATITGAGVHVNAEQQNFRQGEMRQTNNSLDAALDGNGFFVFDRDGQRYYSRAGQFEFDKDGFLTDRISGARVMVSSESNVARQPADRPVPRFPAARHHRGEARRQPGAHRKFDLRPDQRRP